MPNSCARHLVPGYEAAQKGTGVLCVTEAIGDYPADNMSKRMEDMLKPLDNEPGSLVEAPHNQRVQPVVSAGRDVGTGWRMPGDAVGRQSSEF